MKTPSSIISCFEESIFTQISDLALRHHAINLSQGIPEFDGPLFVKQAAIQAILSKFNQQGPASGNLNLREAVSEIYRRHYQLHFDPQSEITITCGATEALFCSLQSILNPGDEVIVFEPFFDTYLPAIQMCHAKAVVQTLYAPDFQIDFDQLKLALSKNTKAMILNYPHNPTGQLLSVEAVQKLADLVDEFDLYVVSDEVYQFLIYDHEAFTPLAKHAKLRERTFTISSTGKSLSFTGWRVGWVAASPQLSSLVRRVHQNVTFAAPNPLQQAAAAGFENYATHLPEFIESYQSKRDLLFNGLQQLGLKPLLPRSTYFILCPVPEGQSDTDFVEKMIRKHRVAAIPCSAFYQHKEIGGQWIRFCFAKEEQTLVQACQRLVGII